MLDGRDEGVQKIAKGYLQNMREYVCSEGIKSRNWLGGRGWIIGGGFEAFLCSASVRFLDTYAEEVEADRFVELEPALTYTLTCASHRNQLA